MDKVKKFLNKYGLYVIGAAIVMIIIAIVFSLIPKDENALVPDRDNPPKIEDEEDFFSRVQLPLQFYRYMEVTLPSNIKKQVDEYDGKYVGYKVKDVSHSELVAKALEGMNKEDLKFQKVGEIFYTWSDKYNFANYDENTDIFTFSFDDVATVNNLSLISTNDKDIEDFVYKFISTYFGSDMQYSKLSITKESIGITVKFNRQLSGLDIRPVGQRDPYSNYISFTNKGQLKNGKILIAEFEEYAKQKYEIISGKDLEKYINAQEYPKQINFVVNDLTELEMYPDYGYEAETPPFHLEGEVKVKDVSLVYLYSSKRYAVVPGFAMNGEGTVEIYSDDRASSFSMFVNAINPKYIYIPSESYFEDLFQMGK